MTASCDITERKLAAQALRARDERCRLALDLAEIGTFNIDSDNIVQIAIHQS